LLGYAENCKLQLRESDIVLEVVTRASRSASSKSPPRAQLAEGGHRQLDVTSVGPFLLAPQTTTLPPPNQHAEKTFDNDGWLKEAVVSLTLPRFAHSSQHLTPR